MADPWDVHSRATVGTLLALNRLNAAELLGGRGGREREVTHVRLAPADRSPTGGFRDTVVVLDGARLGTDNFLVDMTLRWMGDAGAPMLVVVSPPVELGLAARRLADKLSVALVVTADTVLDLVDALREAVEAPHRVLAATIVDVVDRLVRVRPSQGIDEMLDIVETSLEAAVSLVGAEGEVAMGSPVEPPIPSRDRLDVSVRSVSGEQVRLVQPVFLASREAPTFWLVLTRQAPTRAWEEAAIRVGHLAASFVATRVVTQRLEQERDARVRLGALNAIVALTERPSAALTEQMSTLGWKTDGWCTAVHLRLGGPADPLRVLSMTDALRHVMPRALAGPIVERADGWTTWLTSATEPSLTSYGPLVVAIRHAVLAFVENRPGLRVYAGVGRPHQGVLGLRKSLAEAQEAATVASASGRRTAVQHIDELGVQRILVGWYTSAEFGDFTRTLLRPVVEADGGEDLLRTLEVYLDNESSPTATADVLGVHRNTVIKRLARIREVIAVDLDDPDQRLAIQLACRVVNLRS